MQDEEELRRLEEEEAQARGTADTTQDEGEAMQQESGSQTWVISESVPSSVVLVKSSMLLQLT